jgi:hypothetical protein
MCLSIHHFFCLLFFFFYLRVVKVKFHVPLNIFPTRCNITQFIYFWKTPLHVSGGISTHHHEHTQLYLQYLVRVITLLLPLLLCKGRNCFECGVGIVLICFAAVAVSSRTKTDQYNSNTTLKQVPTLPQ